MVVSENQFRVLFALLDVASGLTQRELAVRTGLGLGTVNAAVRECEALGFVRDRKLTSSGWAALEPYQVDNAVILAAGMSARFAPISYEKPKGLLQVRGEILIERQIEQLLAAGIGDISVVVGYKKEYFFYLAKKYGVKIVVNDTYASRNNNGSLWVVRDRMANTYVCSSDNYFTENPFDSFVYQAYYSVVIEEGPTDEWCVSTGVGGRIIGVEIGGEDAQVMLGPAYFDRAFSERFKQILERIYDLPETVDKLWEAIFKDNLDTLEMVAHPFEIGVINEFDSLDEVRGFDPLFLQNVDSAVFDNIASALECEREDISELYPLKQGLTNLSCHLRVGGSEYVYRYPGVGTEKLIDRSAEKRALELARELGLDSTFLVVDEKRGWKLSKFVPGSRNLNVDDPEELRRAMEMARELHTSGADLGRAFSFLSEGLGFEASLQENGLIDVPDYFELRQKVMRLGEFTSRDDFGLVPSHNDFFPLNFLVGPGGEMDLIDWEYAGMSDPANDFGTMTVCAELPPWQANAALGYYFGRQPSHEEKRHFWAHVVFAGWCWYVWALVKETAGDDVGGWTYIYYRHAADYVDDLLSWYETGYPPQSLSDGQGLSFPGTGGDDS